jgi:hypothetical protein
MLGNWKSTFFPLIVPHSSQLFALKMSPSYLPEGYEKCICLKLASVNLNLPIRKRPSSLISSFHLTCLTWIFFCRWAVNHKVNRTFGTKSKFLNSVDERGNIIYEHVISKYYGVEAVLTIDPDGIYLRPNFLYCPLSPSS